MGRLQATAVPGERASCPGKARRRPTPGKGVALSAPAPVFHSIPPRGPQRLRARLARTPVPPTAGSGACEPRERTSKGAPTRRRAVSSAVPHFQAAGQGGNRTRDLPWQELIAWLAEAAPTPRVFLCASALSGGIYRWYRTKRGGKCAVLASGECGAPDEPSAVALYDCDKGRIRAGERRREGTSDRGLLVGWDRTLWAVSVFPHVTIT